MKKTIRALFWLLFLLVINDIAATEAWSQTADCGVAAPTIQAERDSSCAGRPVLLWAKGCAGKVTWSNGLEGDTIVSRPANTRAYTATCQEGNCQSAASKAVTIVIPVPEIPVLNTDKKTICAGGSATLTAIGCPAAVIWSNGAIGAEITVRPAQTATYTAICRTESTLGCISCFAEPVEIKVAQGVRPVLVASQAAVCAGDTLSLRVAACAGQAKWADDASISASNRIVQPTSTTTYTAICVLGDCEFTTNPTTVQVAPPATPRLYAERTTLCAGEGIKVTASGCAGTTRWSNGATGSEVMVLAETTLTLTARCEQGTCAGRDSEALNFTVLPKVPTSLVADRNNTCPYVTLDLMTTLKNTPRTTGGRYEFRNGPSAASALVAHPAVSGAGTYYVFERSAGGCYSEAAAVTITINDCQSPVPVCAYFPGSVSIAVDSTATDATLKLTASVNGLVTNGHWSTNGSGSFDHSDSLTTNYLPSANDRLAGHVTLAYATDDPDGEGSCQAAISTVDLAVRAETFVPKLPNTDSLTIVGNKVEADTGADNPVTELTDVFIPEGFSPNGDGINDRFVVANVPVDVGVSLEVYNRWGQLVFKDDDYKNTWEGKAQNGVRLGGNTKGLADGTYFYVVRLTNGDEFVKFMTITH